MQRAFIVAVAAGVLLLPLQLAAQEWTMQSYWEGKPWGRGTIFRLTESAPGQYKARFILAEGLDDCNRREFSATVAQQADEQIVVLHPVLPDCSERRFILKTDGSGGRAEVKQADGTWKWDGYDRNIKRKQ